MLLFYQLMTVLLEYIATVKVSLLILLGLKSEGHVCMYMCIYVSASDIVCILGMKQYYNISIYCNIYYSNTIQYGFNEISIYCTLQYIMIYCNILQYLFS